MSRLQPLEHAEPWIRQGNTGTSLDLVCKYCGASFHEGKHRDFCEYIPDDKTDEEIQDEIQARNDAAWKTLDPHKYDDETQ